MSAATPRKPFERVLLNPVYIARIAGEPAGVLDGLDTGETARLLAGIAALNDWLIEEGEDLVAVIEALVPKLTPMQIRAALSVKRAIFNRRAVKSSDLSRFVDALDPETHERITGYREAWERLKAMEAATTATFENEVAAGTDVLLSMLQRRNFVDGMGYSNPGLLEKFRRRLPVDSPHAVKGKERRNLEDALLQYAARVATKTSPLSSFTTLGVAGWGSRGNDLQMDFDAGIERRVSFKGALFRHLTAALLSDFERAVQLAPLEINPSARINGDRLQLKAVTPGSLGSGRFWGTGEDRVEAGNNVVMVLIARIFDEGGGVPIEASELVRLVCSKASRLTPAAVWPFLARLYQIQYLRPALGVFEQDDAMETYASLVARVGGELGGALRGIVERMREGALAFQAADTSDRSRAMFELQESVRATCELLGVEHDTPLFRPVLFENCYLQPQGELLAPRDLETYAGDMELLLEAAVLTDLSHQTRCQLADFFLATFGPEGVCEDVEAFLETFDEIYAPGKFVAGPSERRAPRSSVSVGLAAAADRFHDLLEPLLRGAGEGCIDAQALRDVLDEVPAPIRNRSLSQSYLLQFARGSGQRLAVVNQMFGGRSALMSRFLEVLDDSGIDAVRAYVRNGSDTGSAVELPGVFGFNANYHPMLADAELGVPPFPDGRADAERVALGSTRMAYDAHTHSVVLQTSEGRRFDVFYQGFLIPSLLPGMHRILALCFGDGPGQFAVPTLLLRNIVEPDVLAEVPRLLLGSLVLSRRIWIIPFDQVPDIDLSPADFFVAVQAWRGRNGLPNEAFFRVIPIPGEKSSGGGAEEVDWNSFNFKNLKPFYVRLDSPRFVRLMQRSLKRDSYSVSLTEALPALDDQHVGVAGEKHVAELQIEMTRPLRSPAPAATLPGGASLSAALAGLPPASQTQPAFADWSTIRIAYFEKDRAALLLGPVREAVEAVRARFGPVALALQTQWKFGPHLELSIDGTSRQEEVFELVSSIVKPWLLAYPSAETIDPDAYIVLSAKLGMSELEPGPYAPLLDDNSLSLVPYRPAGALPIAALAESKHLFLSEALDLQFELLALKEGSADAFSLTLIAMMAVCGTTYVPHGLARGFMSFRSHAEYFLAAYDEQGKLRRQFDALDAAKSAQVDAIMQAVAGGDLERLPLPEAHRDVVRNWAGVVRRTAERNERIVRENHDALVSNDTFDDLVKDLTATAPVDFQERARSRTTSDLGNAFDEEEGRRIQSSPEFIAFRTNVNFFYLILPTLDVSPLQKFCLCHLVANGAERHFGVSWREIVGLAEEATSD